MRIVTTYTAFGEERETYGVESPTDYEPILRIGCGEFSRSENSPLSGYRRSFDFGLMFYNARWYDPCINMFTQPDTIIPDPGNSMDWNRYAYVNYNPINFSDPTGHAYWGGDDYDPADVHDDGMPMEEALLRQQFRAAAQRMWKNREDYILWDVEVDGPGVNLGTPPYPRIHEENEIWPWFKDEDTGLFVEVNIFEYAGSSIPIVCTDVPYLLYLEIGIYIDELLYSPEAFASGYDGSGSVYSENSIMRGSSSVDRYFDMGEYNGAMNVHSGDVFRGDGYHVGAVVNVDDATDPNQIYIMHTSTSQNGLYIHTLADLMGYFSTIEFGYFQEH